MTYTIDINVELALMSDAGFLLKPDYNKAVIKSLKESPSDLIRKLAGRHSNDSTWEKLKVEVSEQYEFAILDTSLYVFDLAPLLINETQPTPLTKTRSFYVPSGIVDWPYAGEIFIRITIYSIYIEDEELKNAIQIRHALCKLASDTMLL